MNILDRVNEEVSIYDLFNLSDPKVKYQTDKKPCQISCPFHGKGDRRPSARVYPSTNSFSCFYCSKSWSAVAFWAQVNDWYTASDKLDFGRAINDLCSRFNITDQTFDWQKKFYSLRSGKKPVSLEEKRSLSDYYSLKFANFVQTLDARSRKSLEIRVISMWNKLDSIDLNSDSWQLDLKNWHEDAKIIVNEAS